MNFKVFLSLLALCVTVYGAGISPFLISVNPSWGACYDTSMTPLAVQCNITVDTSVAPPSSTVAWGQLAAGQPFTSRIHVSGPASSSPVNPGTGGLFLLTKMTHDNYLVTDPNLIPRYIDLSWSVSVQDVSGGQTIPLAIQGKLEVVETQNQASQPAGSSFCDYTAGWQNPYGIQYTGAVPCCPYPTNANNPCSDRLTASINSGGSAPITVGGITYQIKISGFCTSPDATNCNFGQTYSFVSQEEASSVRYLFAQLIVVCSAQTVPCDQRASEISICTSGACVAGSCAFGANPNTLGQSCTPSDPLATACGSNFQCAQANTTAGGVVGLCLAQSYKSTGANCSVSALGPKTCQITTCGADHSCNYQKLPAGTPCGNIAPTECLSYTCQGTQTTDGIDCLRNPAPSSTPCTASTATNPNNLDTNTCAVPRCVNGNCQWVANTGVNGQQCGSNSANNVCSPNTCNNGQCLPNPAPQFSNEGCAVNANPAQCSGACCTTYCNGQGNCIGGTRSTSVSCQLPAQPNADTGCIYGQCAGQGASGSNFGLCAVNYNNTNTVCSPSLPCVDYKCNGAGRCTSVTKADTSSCSPSANGNPNQCQRLGCSAGVCTPIGLASEGKACLWPNENNPQYVGNCSIAICNTQSQCVLRSRPAPTYSGGSLQNYYQCQSSASLNGPCAYYGCDGSGNCVIGYYPAGSNVQGCTGQPDQCSNAQCPGNSAICGAVARNGPCTQVPLGSGNTVGTQYDNKYCTYGVCSNRQCVSNFATANSSCDITTNPNSAAPGACQRAACDANGNCQVFSFNNPAKCVAQGGVCYTPQCSLNGNSYQCTQTPNNLLCPGKAATPPTDTQCQVEQCVTGTCQVQNKPDDSSCSLPGSPGQCRKYACRSGACTAVIANTGCTGSQPCNTYQCNLSTGNCDPVPNNNAQCTGTGTLDACHVWGCGAGQCAAIPGNNGAACPGSNPCVKYSCNNGACVSDNNAYNNISCAYTNLPQCKKAICQAGSCIAVNAYESQNCDANVTLGNTCNVRKCFSGTCTNVPQDGVSCLSNGNDTICLRNTCSGTVCGQAARNENTPCDPRQNNATGDAACTRSVCISGQCLIPTAYWDGTACGQGSQGVCSEYHCTNGICDRTTNYNVAAGTSCSRSDNPCIDYQCNKAGQCVSANAVGTPCYNPILTFKRAAAAPTNRTLLSSGCQAYTCSGGSCTSTIQNINGGACVGNFTDKCLSGICAGGKCLPSILSNCSACEQYKDCKSCQAGSFAGKRAVTATDPCRQNPNLPGCPHKCSWCGGQCLSTSEVTEYNTYYPPGSKNNRPCTGQCPVVLVGGDGSSLALPLGLGLGLGGGLVLLALLAAAAAIIALIVKRKMASPDAAMATTAFVENAAAAVNPLHVPDGAVQSNVTYAG